ncbi:unnamed protein product [Cochlearia groenlandica]
MVARRENIVVTVAEEQVNPKSTCLMLLSRVGESTGGCGGGGGDGGESRVYRCKTCMKDFSSFQALGGHRASHSKPINNNNNSDDTSSSSLSLGSVAKRTKKTKSHTCPICGMDFAMGQALGGHMRKHRNEKNYGGGALVTRSLFSEMSSSGGGSSSTKTTAADLKKSICVKRVAAACLDSDLDSVESGLNLKLELGIAI